jgi:hypothetical protein
VTGGVITRTSTQVVPFQARDGMPLDLHHVVGGRPATRGPVLLVHGAGVRADIFRPPEPITVVDALLEDGWDVWLENWRASIDVRPNQWDLDQAAVLDHPVAVRTVLEHTGASTLKAVIHCQGSSSFALAAVAGLLPEVDTIVSNAMSLHPVVPPFSRFKIGRVAPLVDRFLDYVDPHWGVEPPRRLLERAVLGLVELGHHECDNAVCHMVSFAYGSGFPALWSHENLSGTTHRWLREEFGPVPFAFYAHMRRSIAARRLVPTGTYDELGADPVGAAPRTDARFVLLAGTDNLCFLPESQQRTFDHLDRHAPGRHTVHLVDGYGHLDVFLGRYAARDTFPLVLKELAA